MPPAVEAQSLNHWTAGYCYLVLLSDFKLSSTVKACLKGVEIFGLVLMIMSRGLTCL